MGTKYSKKNLKHILEKETNTINHNYHQQHHLINRKDCGENKRPIHQQQTLIKNLAAIAAIRPQTLCDQTTTLTPSLTSVSANQNRCHYHFKQTNKHCNEIRKTQLKISLISPSATALLFSTNATSPKELEKKESKINLAAVKEDITKIVVDLIENNSKMNVQYDADNGRESTEIEHILVSKHETNKLQNSVNDSDGDIDQSGYNNESEKSTHEIEQSETLSNNFRQTQSSENTLELPQNKSDEFKVIQQATTSTITKVYQPTVNQKQVKTFLTEFTSLNVFDQINSEEQRYDEYPLIFDYDSLTDKNNNSDIDDQEVRDEYKSEHLSRTSLKERISNYSLDKKKQINLNVQSMIHNQILNDNNLFTHEPNDNENDHHDHFLLTHFDFLSQYDEIKTIKQKSNNFIQIRDMYEKNLEQMISLSSSPQHYQSDSISVQSIQSYLHELVERINDNDNICQAHIDLSHKNQTYISANSSIIDLNQNHYPQIKSDITFSYIKQQSLSEGKLNKNNDNSVEHLQSKYESISEQAIVFKQKSSYLNILENDRNDGNKTTLFPCLFVYRIQKKIRFNVLYLEGNYNKTTNIESDYYSKPTLLLTTKNLHYEQSETTEEFQIMLAAPFRSEQIDNDLTKYIHEQVDIIEHDDELFYQNQLNKQQQQKNKNKNIVHQRSQSTLHDEEDDDNQQETKHYQHDFTQQQKSTYRQPKHYCYCRKHHPCIQTDIPIKCVRSMIKISTNDDQNVQKENIKKRSQSDQPTVKHCCHCFKQIIERTNSALRRRERQTKLNGKQECEDGDCTKKHRCEKHKYHHRHQTELERKNKINHSEIKKTVNKLVKSGSHRKYYKQPQQPSTIVPATRACFELESSKYYKSSVPHIRQIPPKSKHHRTKVDEFLLLNSSTTRMNNNNRSQEQQQQQSQTRVEIDETYSTYENIRSRLEHSPLSFNMVGPSSLLVSSRNHKSRVEPSSPLNLPSVGRLQLESYTAIYEHSLSDYDQRLRTMRAKPNNNLSTMKRLKSTASLCEYELRGLSDITGLSKRTLINIFNYYLNKNDDNNSNESDIEQKYLERYEFEQIYNALRSKRRRRHHHRSLSFHSDVAFYAFNSDEMGGRLTIRETIFCVILLTTEVNLYKRLKCMYDLVDNEQCGLIKLEQFYFIIKLFYRLSQGHIRSRHSIDKMLDDLKELLNEMISKDDRNRNNSLQMDKKTFTQIISSYEPLKKLLQHKVTV
ncbi:unnamed protein product [Didymodactylos carnosus]|uniref:EF-hand domain-containing protein n=1 Tax=Didymodactylos carnosus TaxID=1234261 RepID=A0A813W5B0_9BILA|nr:unnamed protein product [Didymodactylos carnosus]CAF0907852.1 unnamed protein product [Didymodactylos carnosus]CAF3643627.1 unnamed protein product [Didymodactylos carnosus]CAF3687431.1 unnamed protein product [Didymodactylos carnosus]